MSYSGNFFRFRNLIAAESANTPWLDSSTKGKAALRKWPRALMRRIGPTCYRPRRWENRFLPPPPGSNNQPWSVTTRTSFHSAARSSMMRSVISRIRASMCLASFRPRSWPSWSMSTKSRQAIPRPSPSAERSRIDHPAPANSFFR